MFPSTRLRLVRAYSTVSFPPVSGSVNASTGEESRPRRPPPRPPLEPTVFDGKASPREIHLRPNPMRGMPPSQRKPGSEKPRQIPKKLEEESQSFTGPSRPRAVYTRPSRELPRMKVSVYMADPLMKSRTGYLSVRDFPFQRSTAAGRPAAASMHHLESATYFCRRRSRRSRYWRMGLVRSLRDEQRAPLLKCRSAGHVPAP